MASSSQFLVSNGDIKWKPTNLVFLQHGSNIPAKPVTTIPMRSLSLVSTNLQWKPTNLVFLQWGSNIPARPATTIPMRSLSLVSTNLQCIPALMGSVWTRGLAFLTNSNSTRMLLNSPTAQAVYGLVGVAILSLYVIPWLLNMAQSDGVDQPKIVVEAMRNPLQCLMAGCVLLNYCVQAEVKLLTIKHKNQLLCSLVVGCGLWFTNILKRDFMEQRVRALKKDEDGKKVYIDLFYADNFLNAALWSVVGVCCLKIWNIQGDKMFNSLGLGGALVTYISKDLFKNILIGMSMRFNNYFQVGDTIQVGNIEGKVLKMGLVSVSLLNEDEFLTYFSYAALCTKELVNKSHDKFSIVKIKFSMPLIGWDVIQIIRDINEKLNAYDGITAAKPPYCQITGLKNTWVEVSIQAFFPKEDENHMPDMKSVILCDAIQIIKSHKGEGSMEIDIPVEGHGAVVSIKRK